MRRCRIKTREQDIATVRRLLVKQVRELERDMQPRRARSRPKRRQRPERRQRTLAYRAWIGLLRRLRVRRAGQVHPRLALGAASQQASPVPDRS